MVMIKATAFIKDGDGEGFVRYSGCDLECNRITIKIFYKSLVFQ